MSTEGLPLSLEERLKALLFQYVKLYERWSEDRQTFTKNMAEQTERLEDFRQKVQRLKKHLQQFEQLEPHVRQNLEAAVENASRTMADYINQHVGASVTAAVDNTTQDLNRAMASFYETLQAYQAEMQRSQVITILLTIGTAIAASLLIVRFMLPKPSLPLSSQDIDIYLQGVHMQHLWPTLSRKTQIAIDETAKKHFGVSQPFGALNSSNTETGHS